MYAERSPGPDWDDVAFACPPAPAPAPAAPLAPEVAQMPRDSTEPTAQEPDYYVDPYAREAATPPMLTEPSVSEPLLPAVPEEKKFPWLWVLLGAGALGVGGYLVMRD